MRMGSKEEEHGLTVTEAWSSSAPRSDAPTGRAEIMDTVDAV